MKLSIFSNDKTTMKDEIIISAVLVIALIIGVLLLVFRPAVWFISEANSVVFGVFLIAFFILMLPGLIYRFLTNSEINKKEK